MRLTKFIQENGGSLPDVLGALPGAALQAGTVWSGRSPSGLGLDESNDSGEAIERGDRGARSSVLTDEIENPRVTVPPVGGAPAPASLGAGRGEREVDGRRSLSAHSPARSHARSPLRQSYNDYGGDDDGDSSLFDDGPFASGIGLEPSPGRPDWGGASYYSHSPAATGRSRSPNQQPSVGGGAGRWARHGVAGRWSARQAASRSPPRQQFGTGKR